MSYNPARMSPTKFAFSLVKSNTPLRTSPTVALPLSLAHMRTYITSSGAGMICILMAIAISGCGSGVTNLSLLDPPGGTASSVFSVTAYGAKGDGIADDGPAINRAINAAITAGGGQVVFPCGEFSLQSVTSKVPGSRSLLYYDGAPAVQLLGKGHCSHLFTTMHQKSVLEFENSKGVSVTSLRITALNAQYVETYGWDGGSAVRFTAVSNGNISNVEVDGASAAALYLTKGTNASSVSNNYVHDIYGSAVWEDDCGASSATSCSPSVPPKDNIYDSNTFTNTAGLSIDDGNGVSNAVIKNNIISWTQQSLSGNPKIHCIGVNNASNVSVLNNSCTGTPWDAIVITTGTTGKSAGVTIQGNTILNSGTSSIGGSGIVVYDAPLGRGVSGFTISSNTITTAAEDGILLVAASKQGNVQQAQVQGNTIDLVDQRSPGSHFGIDIENSDSITANSNSITCNGKCIAAGVKVYASTNTVPTVASNQVVNILGVPLLIR